VTGAAVIRAELGRFPRDPVNGKFLLLLPAGVLLSLWPYAGSPLFPLFLCVLAGLEPQFNNMLFRTPREFEAMSLLPVDWRAVVVAKNAAAVLLLFSTLIPFGAVLAYFSPLPLAPGEIGRGAAYLASIIFPLLVLGNIHSVEHPRRTVGIGPGDIAEALVMILGGAASSLPALLAAGSGIEAPAIALWTALGAILWWTWSVPRTAARIVSERTRICQTL
jgi:hypothetical protein